MEKHAAGMTGPDWIMVAGYFVIMLGIGAWFYSRMRGVKDYFSGGNRIPWWLSGVSFYMSSFSVAAFVFYPSLCYRHGWVGVTLLWVAVPATLFGVLFFAARWRRARVDSPVEYLETRYSPLLRQLFAWQGIPVRMIDDGIKLVATGTFISVCVGVGKAESIVAAGALILLYTFMGGLWAVAVTDFIQFVVLTAAVLIILPMSVMRAGGLGAVLENAPEGFFRLTAPEFGWGYIIPLVALYALAWSSINWSLIQRYYCVPRERDAVKVGALVMALYVVGPPMMFFPAIAATRFLPGLEDASQVYPLLCTNLLPPGMLGLAVAAMFAATMSTLSSDYNVCAGVLTTDVYRRLLRPGADQGELVAVGRTATALVGVVALGAALLIARGSGEGLFRTMVTLFGVATAPVAVPMLLGLVSKRYTNASAVAGFLLGLATGLGLYAVSKMAAFEAAGLSWNPDTEDLALGPLVLKMEIAMFLATALVTWAVMAVVSAALPAGQAAAARTEAFLARLRAPIGSLPEDDHGEGSAESPFRIVGAAVLPVGLLLLAVTPWLGGGLVLALNVAIGGGLAVVGAALAFARAR